MRKLLLSFAAMIMALVSYSQTTQNLITPSGKGFEYKFAGPAVDNCSPDGTAPTYPITVSSVWLDLFGQPSSDFEITSLGGGSIVYKIKSGTPSGTYLKIRFPKQTCDFSSEVV